MPAARSSPLTINLLSRAVFFLKLWVGFISQWGICGWKLSLEYLGRHQALIVIYLLVFIQVLVVISSSNTNSQVIKLENQLANDLVSSYFYPEKITQTFSSPATQTQNSETVTEQIIQHPTNILRPPELVEELHLDTSQIQLTTSIEKNSCRYPVGRELLVRKALFSINRGQLDVATQLLDSAKRIDPGWTGWQTTPSPTQ